MADKVNLNLLKNEIDNRKKEKNQVSSRLGENLGGGTNLPPRDAFLNGLLESFQTGRDTHSSVLVKSVVNKVAEKNNESAPIRNVTSQPAAQFPTQSPQRIKESDMAMSPERDEQLFADLANKRKMTLAESIEGFTKMPAVGAPMQNQSANYQQPMQINEAYLTENVKHIVNNYLVENFGPIVEEAIKSTILEMYAVERIKEVLHENKELIRTVVIDTIKEIQAKNKAKAQ